MEAVVYNLDLIVRSLTVLIVIVAIGFLVTGVMIFRR